MMRGLLYCCVPQCQTKSTKSKSSFHQFPSDADKVYRMDGFGNRYLVSRRKEWIRLLRIGRPIKKRMVVCSEHFTQDDYFLPGIPSKKRFLKKTAVPSRNLPILSHDRAVPSIKQRGQRQRNGTQECIETLPLSECIPSGIALTNDTTSCLQETSEDVEFDECQWLSDSEVQEDSQMPLMPKQRQRTRTLQSVKQVTSLDVIQRREKNRIRQKRWRDSKKLKSELPYEDSEFVPLLEASNEQQPSIKIEKESESSSEQFWDGNFGDVDVKTEGISGDVKSETGNDVSANNEDRSPDVGVKNGIVGGKGVCNETNFLYHMMFGAGDYRYVCAFCGKNFTMRNTAVTHLTTLHGGRALYISRKQRSRT